MKSIFRIMALSAAILLSASCLIRIPNLKKEYLRAESGPVLQRVETVSPFYQLNVEGPVPVSYQPDGDRYAVEAVLPESILDSLRIKVEDGILDLSFPRPVILRNKDAIIRVYAPGLRRGCFSGSGDVFLHGLSGDMADLSIWGSGDMTLFGAQVDTLLVSISGSGDIKGNDLQCDTTSVDIAGSGDVVLQGITSRNVSVSIIGSGDVRLGGEAGKADVRISGSGDVDLRSFSCPDVRREISGSGDIL